MAIMNLVSAMTALEVARRSSNPDAWTIIELMSMVNTMLRELPAIQANDGAIHSSLIRTSYPHATHRVYNQGVKYAASQTKPQKDKIVILQSYSTVDEKMAQHSGNPAALYDSEAKAFIYGMGEDQADDLIYGSEAQNAAELDGLATRRPYGHEYTVDVNVEAGINAAAGEDSTSMYLVAAGQQACHLIYPKGSNSAGVNREDKGIRQHTDAEGNPYEAHEDLFTAEYGIVIASPDSVIRLMNIPLNLSKAQRAEVIEVVLKHKKKLTKGITNRVAFANEDMMYQIERAAREIELVVKNDEDPWGLEVTQIGDLRLREQDAILSTESLIAQP
jgi:hypothetical protein